MLGRGTREEPQPLLKDKYTEECISLYAAIKISVKSKYALALSEFLLAWGIYREWIMKQMARACFSLSTSSRKFIN